MEIPLQRLLDVLTRTDELLVMLLEVQQQQLKLLQAISERMGVSPPQAVVPPVPPERVAPPEIVVPSTVELTAKSIEELVKKLAERVPQLPNRVCKIEFDTSTTSWKSLREAKKLRLVTALGFFIEEVGGGFEYIIARGELLSDSKVAQLGDRWDVEFDDIQVRGTGVPGNARLWVWWRE